MSELRSTGASRGRVLAIDDDRAMTDVLERQLAMEGFEVTVSTDAAAALELLPARDFDVLLTDLRMRGMDGMELCRSHSTSSSPSPSSTMA